MNELEQHAGLSQTPGYRYADHVGNRLFVAGQVPLDSSARLVGADDVGAQAQQCLTNLFTLIEVHGFGRDDIHHLTVHVVGPRQALTEAWSAVVSAFDSTVPPATLLGVPCLGYDQQLVEIDAHVERVS